MSKDIPADVMERAQAVYAAIGVNWGDDAIGRAAEMRRINVPKIALALLTERREAEQRGAERMREAAASECILVGGDWRDADIEQKAYAANYLADRIRALPTTAEPAVQEPRVRKPFRLNVSKEWCMKMAASEGDTEISAGVPEEVRAAPTTLADALTEIEKLHSIYIQACTGRAEFRNALRDARATIASQAEALAAKEAEVEQLLISIVDLDRVVDQLDIANTIVDPAEAIAELQTRLATAEVALKSAREALKAMLDEHAPADDAIRAGMEPPCNDMARAALTKGA